MSDQTSSFFSISSISCAQESVADDGDEESDRSKSEVNDEDDEETGEVSLLAWRRLHKIYSLENLMISPLAREFLLFTVASFFTFLS